MHFFTKRSEICLLEELPWDIHAHHMAYYTTAGQFTYLAHICLVYVTNTVKGMMWLVINGLKLLTWPCQEQEQHLQYSRTALSWDSVEETILKTNNQHLNRYKFTILSSINGNKYLSRNNNQSGFRLTLEPHLRLLKKTF